MSAGREFSSLRSDDGKTELTPAELATSIGVRRLGRAEITDVIVPELNLLETCVTIGSVSPQFRIRVIDEALLLPDPAFPPYFLGSRFCTNERADAWRRHLGALPWHSVTGAVDSADVVRRALNRPSKSLSIGATN
jgi:hypothetical protein